MKSRIDEKSLIGFIWRIVFLIVELDIVEINVLASDIVDSDIGTS